MRRPNPSIQLFGSFSLRTADGPVTALNTPRLESLIAYLILHADTPQSRQHVAFVLWPDTPESRSRNNLRQLLYQLRQILDDADRFLQVDTNTVLWKKDSGQQIDVDLFMQALGEAALAERKGDAAALKSSLQRARSYYRGDLLPECYDDWIAPERERLRIECQHADQKLLRVLESEGDYAAALEVGQRSLGLNPLDEDTYLALIHLHGLKNDRAGAQSVFQTAVQTFERELGVEPSEELHQALMDIRPAPAPSRQPAFANIAVPPSNLIGRKPEWEKLLAAWQRTAAGNARFALISGEAGIGKSHLAQAFFDWSRTLGISAARTRSYAAEGRLSLAPVAEWLRSDSIYPYLATLDRVWMEQIARLLPELLTEHKGLNRPEPIAEFGQRQLFFQALARAVHNPPPPLLLWIDDLQWSDPETLDWLYSLLRYDPYFPVLILGTARSEEYLFDHPLSRLVRRLRTEDTLDFIELSPLDAAETRQLASQIQGSEPDLAAAMRLFRETEGNPLFVVETVRANLGGPQKGSPEIPTLTPMEYAPSPRVHAVIAGRLSQLSPAARRTAELGAVIGHAFTPEMLAQAGHADEEQVISALDELWQKRILCQRDVNQFDFTHDKLREVAYAEISAPQRLLLHHRVAQAIEGLYADSVDPVSAEIAAQYEQAGLYDKAIPFYERAGQVAAGVYANDDAVGLLTRGLELLTRVPHSAKRDAHELSFQLALAPLYRITKGWASQQVEQTLNRVSALNERVGTNGQRIQTLYGLQFLYVVQARLDQVQSTFHEMRKLMIQTEGRLLPFAGLSSAGASLHMGYLTRARSQFEEIVATRDDNLLLRVQASQGTNYLVHALAWNSHALWCLGYPQQALEGAQAAVHLAQEFAEPFNQALAITYLALLQGLCADMETFQAQARQALALTHEYQAPYYHAWAAILARFAEAWQRPSSANLNSLTDAIQDFTRAGARLRMPFYLSLVARAYQRAGRHEEGLDVIEQGLAEAKRNGEHWWDAELYRLRGELLGIRGRDTSATEDQFRRAIEIAQGQRAKSLELRAATSLARLWQSHSREPEAKQLLTPLLDWFTEGLDTQDLMTARALACSL